MPSPLPASTVCPVDFYHIGRMTFGDPTLEREVLDMFLKQSGRLLDQLAAMPTEAGALAHTLKGSARAIGAFALADSAAAAEDAARKGGDLAGPLRALTGALAEVRGAIEARLARS
jgi:HPt (histidine-containing phosphotransfer) domain-containing protein